MSPQQTPDDPAPGDVVDAVVQTVTARLAELQPYLDEAERLRAILAASGADGGSAVPPSGERPTSGRGARRAATDHPGSRPARTADTTAKGSSKSAIIALIAEQPGVTAADIARASGMKRTVVASTISRLKRTGELEPEGRGVRLPR